jgi:hypothetical protein
MKMETYLKVRNLKEIGSSPAPKEWKDITEIKELKPKIDIRKHSDMDLFELQGLSVRICVWMVKIGIYWHYASDFILVEEVEGGLDGNV